MGMEATPVRTKSRRQQFRERPDAPSDSLRRAWSAVSKARMVFGLAAAGTVPCIAFWFLLELTNDGLEIRALLITAATVAGLGVSWFVGLGALFLVWVGHTYGAVSRFNCLALCATLGFFTPLLYAVFSMALAPPSDVTESLGRILDGALSGLLFGPLGLFGGWLLWRIAVRPASAPIEEMVEVF
jgi:hypothetical protein